jgi:hypothetical protein
MRHNNFTNQKESLLVDEVVTPHRLEGIPLGQWCCCFSSTGRKSFQSMRCNNLIDWKEILPVNEA